MRTNDHLRSDSLPLTPREREIVALAAQGMIDKEIALALGTSVGTVTTHWYRIRAKMRASTRAEITARFTAYTAAANRAGTDALALQEFLDALPVAMLALDSSGVVLGANEASGALLGVPVEGLHGRPVTEATAVVEAVKMATVNPPGVNCSGVMANPGGIRVEWTTRSGIYQGQVVQFVMLRPHLSVAP